MLFATAQYPCPEDSQDRVFTTDHAAVVLDGASAFLPVDIPTGTYVDKLGKEITGSLERDPAGELSEIVAHAIAATATDLGLSPGESPSSTVTIVRVRTNEVDLFALGDGAIYYGDGERTLELTDTRLAELGIPEHRHYRERLAEGHGYDEYHRELLGRLQRQQRQRRNRPDGYWIAETEPEAARHAIERTLPRTQIEWAVLATDGAYGPLGFLELNDWPRIARYEPDRLAKLLERCADWEKNSDPTGQRHPRSKVADDKTLATAVIPSA